MGRKLPAISYVVRHGVPAVAIKVPTFCIRARDPATSRWRSGHEQRIDSCKRSWVAAAGKKPASCEHWSSRQIANRAQFRNASMLVFVVFGMADSKNIRGHDGRAVELLAGCCGFNRRYRQVFGPISHQGLYQKQGTRRPDQMVCLA